MTKNAVNNIYPGCPGFLPGFASVISLSDFRLSVNIGVLPPERNVKQELSISFKFYCPKLPKACQTDNIDDTICYVKISDIIKQCCNNREFKLLEHMCHIIYTEMRKSLADDIKIWLKIEKWPVIEHLSGSTSFEYCDIW